MLAHLSHHVSARRFPILLRLGLVPIVAALVLVGIWVSGGLLTNNFRLSMLFTTLWLGLVGLMALVVAWRWRPLALPVLGAAFVTAAVAGGYLLYASSVDKVVNEQVAIADVPIPTPAETSPAGGDEAPAPAKNVALGRGPFTSGEHETSGKATLVRLAKGGTVLTLTAFDTSPGPDLRVYLVTGGPDELGDVVDLGGLKGNKGDQQYDVPASVDLKRHRTVVIWCRAFSVAFGSARLA
jgi:hypothetical protein